MRSTVRDWVLIVAAVVVVCAVVVGLWFLYWPTARSAQDRRYDINTHSQQYQSGLVSQERDRAQGWLNATDATQKSLIGSMFCATYLDLTQVPADLSQAAAEIHCAN